MNGSPLKNWIPYKLVNKNGQLECHWLNTHNHKFNEPFFDETIAKCKIIGAGQFAKASVSSLTMVEDWAESLVEVKPAAIIFHISRCGSTLVSQLLSTDDENIVLPEVPFFDDLLRLPFRYRNFNPGIASKLLVAAIKYYGQERSGKEKRLYIKADSWHIFFYDQLRNLYPNVPFILMYRNPNEVFSSHKKLPGMQSVSGLIEPAVFGFKDGEEVPYLPDAYLSAVLERYLEKYHEIIGNDQHVLLINYNEGPMPIMQKIAAFTGTPISNESLAVMEERSRYHSKKPDEVFSEALSVIIPECMNKAMALYYTLEEKRVNV